MSYNDNELISSTSFNSEEKIDNKLLKDEDEQTSSNNIENIRTRSSICKNKKSIQQNNSDNDENLMSSDNFSTYCEFETGNFTGRKSLRTRKPPEMLMAGTSQGKSSNKIRPKRE